MSPIAKVDHLFKHRINSSLVHASDYLKQFPSPIISIIAKFISFVSGGFAAILIIIAFLEESLLEGHIFGRNLFWYAAVFGTITAISRAAISDELLVLDPEGAMSMVVQYTHYMPKTWRGKENTEGVRVEFESLFQYTGMMLLEEMASIFLTPYLLVFVIPKEVDDILEFITEFTIDVEGVGHVCSFSAFDFQKHGNRNYGSPFNVSRSQRSSQGKMEKSFLSFQCSYPSWDPNAQGQQFLLNLRTFREQKLQGQGTRHPAYSSPRMSPSSPRRGFGGMNYFARERPHHNPINGYQLGSLWLIDVDQKNHPYLLDWYYTSAPHHTTTYTRDIPEEPFEGTEQHSVDWMPPNFTDHGVRFEDLWDHQQYEDPRSRSYLEASTSDPFSRDNVLQHHDAGTSAHQAQSHCWDRTGRHSTQPQSSFLEPPNFMRQPSDRFNGNFSYRSLEEQDEELDEDHEHELYESHNAVSAEQDEEQELDWRRNYHNLSRTTYMGDLDLEAGEYNLHFDDVYSRRPDTPKI